MDTDDAAFDLLGAYLRVADQADQEQRGDPQTPGAQVGSPFLMMLIVAGVLASTVTGSAAAAMAINGVTSASMCVPIAVRLRAAAVSTVSQ